MYTYQSFIKEIFDSFKCMHRYDLLKCIPIYGDDGMLVAYLRPITQDYRISLPGCLEQLANWRNENPSLSVQQFAATAASTEVWLDNLIIGREDRLLFFIVLPGGRRVGHIGYSCFNYEKASCEVDAVLRGEKEALPGIMTYALRALIRFGIETLGLREIELRVFSDNSHAIEYYVRNAFFITHENLPGTEGGKRYTRMRLNIDAWKAQNPV